MVKRKDKYKPETIREVSKRAIQRARQTNCLSPHELLRYWANGIAIAGVTPDAEMQVQCAIASAPYYAPKMQSIESKTETTVRAVIAATPLSSIDWVNRYAPTVESLPSQTLEVPPLPTVSTNNIVSTEDDAEIIEHDDDESL